MKHLLQINDLFAVRPSDEPVPTGASAVQPCGAAPFTFQAVTGGQLGHVGRDLVLNYHYSGTFHPVYVLMGLAYQGSEAVAACCFRTPAAKWRYPVLELARLVRKDESAIPLTWLISKTVTAVKHAGAYDLLISYADQTHKHHGGIYQAASWNFSHQTSRQNDGVIVDGTFIAGRACNNKFGTRSVTKLEGLFPGQSFVAHWDEGKYLYWRALSRKAEREAEKLGLKKSPFPKPMWE